MIEKLGGEISTYTETTGNGGVHWIYKYDPKKIGYVIKQQEGFMYNGINKMRRHQRIKWTLLLCPP